MGRFIEIQCKCGAKQNISIGMFFLGPTEEDVYKEIYKNPQYESLRKYVSSPKDISDDYKNFKSPVYNLFYCNKCNYLYSLLDFHLKNQIVQVIHKCEICNSELENLGQSFEKILKKQIRVSCPKCKTKDILKDDLSNLNLGSAD